MLVSLCWFCVVWFVCLFVLDCFVFWGWFGLFVVLVELFLKIQL